MVIGFGRFISLMLWHGLLGRGLLPHDGSRVEDGMQGGD